MYLALGQAGCKDSKGMCWGVQLRCTHPHSPLGRLPSRKGRALGKPASSTLEAIGPLMTKWQEALKERAGVASAGSFREGGLTQGQLGPRAHLTTFAGF